MNRLLPLMLVLIAGCSGGTNESASMMPARFQEIVKAPGVKVSVLPHRFMKNSWIVMAFPALLACGPADRKAGAK